MYYNQKIQESLKEFWVRHLKSFAKTYLTVFLILYLKDITGGVGEGGDFDIFNLAVIIPASKWATLAVLRTVYKVVAE